MKTNVGLWIDHRQAVIVSITDNIEKTRRILSHMERHVRFAAGAQDATAEDHRDKRFTGHLHKYYDEVVSCLRDADAILILGPGEAKIELKARLQLEALVGRITGIETVDKMTVGQIEAKVRQHFSQSGGPDDGLEKRETARM